MRHRLGAVIVFLSLIGTSGMAAAGPPAPERQTYGILYTAWIKAGESQATVKIRISRQAQWVHWVRLSADAKRYSKFTGTGEIKVDGDTVHWTPPKDDAYLQFRVNLESRRESGRYDGYITEDWGMFRADDLIPPIHLDMEDGTESESKLQLNLPDGWTAVTPFPRYSSGRYRIDNPRRLFDRPTGWVVIGKSGKVGTRRESIGSTLVAVTGPSNQGVRRMDIMAFLRWTLPTLQSLFEEPLERLLIVSAGDPMWRGALSGPASLFVHADRPMISENATSTLIHELIHVSMSARSVPGADWIVEGLAEYYSLEILKRSGAISEARFEKAHKDLGEWAKSAGPLDSARSSGAITARAVGVLRTIDKEIKTSSQGRGSLDDVMRQLGSAAQPITLAQFRKVAEKVAGKRLATIPK